jgi:hypothetical protein
MFDNDRGCELGHMILIYCFLKKLLPNISRDIL